MQIALRMADEEGLGNITIASLAARLGIRRQSLYAHVGSYDALLRDLQIHNHLALGERLRTVVKGLSRQQALRAVVRESVLYEREHRGSLTTPRERPGPADVELQDAMDAPRTPVLEVLARYGIVGDEATVWYRAVWATVIGYATLSETPLWFSIPAEDTLDTLVSALTAGVEQASRKNRRAVHS